MPTDESHYLEMRKKINEWQSQLRELKMSADASSINRDQDLSLLKNLPPEHAEHACGMIFDQMKEQGIDLEAYVKQQEPAMIEEMATIHPHPKARQRNLRAI